MFVKACRRVPWFTERHAAYQEQAAEDASSGQRMRLHSEPDEIVDEQRLDEGTTGKDDERANTHFVD